MANCINKNSVEFKNLVEQTNLNPIILAAKISIWQDKNGVENFPTVDELTIETDQSSILLQKDDMLASKSSKATLELVKQAGEKMGINFMDLQEYLKGNPEIEDKGLNGLADLTKGVVAVAQGKEDAALTEEVVHVATAILEQTNPKLITELISKIDRFKIYKTTLEAYKGNKNYQLSNGKPDIRKIKKEAVDKLIAEVIIYSSEGSVEFPELSDEETRSIIKKWWEIILDYLRGVYRKNDIDIFKKGGEEILAGSAGTIEDIKSEGIYLQIDENESKEKVDEAYNRIKSFRDRMALILERLNSKGGVEKKRHYTLDGKEIANSVTEKIGKNKTFSPRTPEEKKLDDIKQKWGNEGHEYIQKYVEKNLIGKDGHVLDEFGNEAIESELPEGLQKALASHMKSLISTYPSGTRFMVETMVVNQQVKGKLGSTADFLAIIPDKDKGVVFDILDWKFTSVNLNFDNDIPFYKKDSWRPQMGEYVEILQNYGFKRNQIQKSRMIPFIMNFGYAKKGDNTSEIVINSMEIGKLDVNEETNLYLLPVPVKTESTGNPVVDKLVRALYEHYERVANKSRSEINKEKKVEELKELNEAIRNLHLKVNFEPLKKVMETFLASSRGIIREFEKIDYSALTSEELNNYLGILLEHGESAAKFMHVGKTYLSQYPYAELTVEQKQLYNSLTTLSSKAEEVLPYISELYRQAVTQYAIKEGFTSAGTSKEDFLRAEKEVEGFAKTFLEGSKLSNRVLKMGVNLIMKTRNEVALRYSKEMDRFQEMLIPLEKIAQKTGKSAFSFIGEMTEGTLKLYNKLDPKFVDDIKKNKKDRNKGFFLKNMDVIAYNTTVKEFLEKKNKELDNSYYSSDTEINTKEIFKRKMQLKNSLDIESEFFDGYESYFFSVFFNKHLIEKGHYSKEYMEMEKNPEALKVWEFFREKNYAGKNMGYLGNKGASFFPLIEATTLQKLKASGNKAKEMQDFFKDLYRTDYDEAVGYSKIDPETNQLKKVKPKYFTRSNKEVHQLSQDLNKVGSLWTKALMDYEANSNIENILHAMLKTEESRGSIVTDSNGNIVREEGEIVVNFDKSGSAETFATIIDDYIYGHRENLNSLGNSKLSEGVKTVTSGTDEETDEKVISIKKGFDNANVLVRALGVGLKPLLSISNFFGFNFQSYINAGDVYKYSEFLSNYKSLTKLRGMNTPEKVLLHLTSPLTEDIASEKIRKTAGKISKNDYISTWSFSDVMQITNSYPERGLQYINAMTFNQNHMVIDGKIVGIRQYLKAKDRETKYKLSESERKILEKSFEKRVKELKSTQALDKIVDLSVDGGEIPGVSLEELAKYRLKIQKYTQNLNGQMDSNDKAGYSRDLVFRSFMMFKGWIPKQISLRTLDINKNFELDNWEYGRARLFIKTWSHLGIRNLMSMRDIISGNEKGMAIMKEMLDQKKKDYERKTGQVLEITEEEFYDLMRQTLLNQVKELQVLFGLIGLWAGVRAAEPPEDATQAERNRYNYFAKMSNKVVDELFFYYNPLTFEEITKGSILPALGLINKTLKTVEHVSRETYGYATDDEEMMDKAHPIKYSLNIIPGAYQAQTEILPLVAPETAKERGIKTSPFARRN